MSPFYLVLYIFIALIVLLCVVSFAMYMCHVCSGVCGDNSDLEANGIVYLDERQPLSHSETNFIDDDPERVTNVREFARKYEQNMHNNTLTNHNPGHANNTSGHYSGHQSSQLSIDSDDRSIDRTISNHIDSCSAISKSMESTNKCENNTLYKNNFAPPIPPKPTVPVMVHSQPSSKKNSNIDPPSYNVLIMSNQSTPCRSSTTSTDSPCRRVTAPKRKPPPPPPPPKPVSLTDGRTTLTDDFLNELPPPRDSMLPPPDLQLDHLILPPPPIDGYLSDDSFHRQTDNYLSDCD